MNAFICIVPLHYYFYKTIYENLENSEFLIPPICDRPFSREYGGGMTGRGQFDYVRDFLNRKKVKVADYGEITKENFVNYINENITNIVCPHMFSGIEELDNKRIIKLVYGIPSDTRSLKYEYLYLMDIVITFGLESAERISSKGIKTCAIGNPLFDDWFKGKISEEGLNMIRSKIDINKPTLLYLPTWGKDSSVDAFLTKIASFSNDYNVIIKLHHGTFLGEINRLIKCLSFPKIVILGDYFDPLPLYKVSDVVITDGISGVTFDALLLDKPVLTIGSSIKNYGISGNSFSDIDLLDSIPFVDSPEKLKEALQGLSKNHLLLDREIKEKLFFYLDGQAGKRAADIIYDEKDFFSVPMLEKYRRALNRIKDLKQNDVIKGAKNIYLRRYFPRQMSKNQDIFLRMRRYLFTKT